MCTFFTTAAVAAHCCSQLPSAVSVFFFPFLSLDRSLVSINPFPSNIHNPSQYYLSSKDVFSHTRIVSALKMRPGSSFCFPAAQRKTQLEKWRPQKLSVWRDAWRPVFCRMCLSILTPGFSLQLQTYVRKVSPFMGMFSYIFARWIVPSNLEALLFLFMNRHISWIENVKYIVHQ